MSASTAIGMVSESLRNLLSGKMVVTSTPDVTILAPDEKGKEKRINLFLYKVQENQTLKNMDWQVKRDDTTRLVPPPLSLNLFYLMTAYAKSDQQTGSSTAHEILGDAMRVFYENPVIHEDYLADGLKGAREQVKIMLNSLDLEELSNVWGTFSVPFRLSVAYEVSVVQLDMLSESERAMATRARQIGVPAVGLPYQPPEVEKIAPAQGPAGSIITCRGKNLSGWKAYVSIMNRTIVDGEDLGSDSFEVTIPADLLPGFYEVRIDISHLSRKTFFFEVT
ncbi:MAG: DUF4255 domain-containing protein [Deltaproteobacteria bacterium]|nr:DUF4255 domain-containing protein [Deltaproteobacteria bacterium]